MRPSWYPALLNLVCLALFAAASASAQPTRLMEDVLGFGEIRPVARVLFHQEAEEVCATLAINSVPKAPHKNMFLFRRLVEPKTKGSNSRLTFKFSNKPDRIADGFQIWVACTASTVRFTEAERDVVELTVRRANSLNESLKLFVEYPDAGEASAMDILSDGNDGLMGRGSIRPL
jgi:hypothetical protein